MARPVNDEKVRRVAIELLMRGICTPSDIARLAGVARQTVDWWIKAAGLDWRAAYDARVLGAWRAGMNGPSPPQRKARMRRVATKAKGDWDAMRRPGQALPHEADDSVPPVSAYGDAIDIP